MDASRNSKHNQHSSDNRNNVVNINLKSTHAEAYNRKKQNKDKSPRLNNKGKNKNQGSMKFIVGSDNSMLRQKPDFVKGGNDVHSQSQ